MALLNSELNFDNAVEYHYERFPPTQIDYSRLLGQLVKAGGFTK
ncbi:hypothetical protein AZOA_15690 [Azoarcus sp. Aa7]|nr:hypothetical protein [Azoarcus sp. Aa7]